MKKMLFLVIFIFLGQFAFGQNYIYMGDDSYPASEIKYFNCTVCGWNSYQEKKRNLSKYNTLEFQTADYEEGLIVRISVASQNDLLSEKISIFFEDGQRLILSKPKHKEKIESMQELFFVLDKNQKAILYEKTIAKIHYGITKLSITINGKPTYENTMTNSFATPFIEK